MRFYADLHVHSKYSRATSRDADLEHMAFWARKKGISVLGTGDFTHPGWFREIEEKLTPAEPGLFRLRPELEAQVEEWLGPSSTPATRFLLEVEISTIYKKGERTRKVHHLIYVPDLEKARKLSESLARIGNIASDGRPILGLDSRDLLEITLEAGEGCYLVPAHIWTPWFAVLGSKSGFDAVEECYGDLTSEIFAVETGLSSDPAMNRRLSILDRYTLVSNSDAHSPPRIGREACAFDTDLDYFAMRQALETGQGYGGTVEFFAEEGKYHLDGHRKCGVRLSPEESRENDGLCPECGKPLTLGVMHRVSELADRDEPAAVQDDAPYQSFIPLEEVISEVEGTGPRSKAVQRRYESLVSRLGAELFILGSAPIEDIEQAGSPIVAEALSRMRQGRVIRDPGFDGQYGTIRLFTEDELERKTRGPLLFDFPDPGDGKGKETGKRRQRKGRTSQEKRQGLAASGEAPPRRATAPEANEATTNACSGTDGGALDELDPEQRRAAGTTEGPLIILAGPGTGKTRTLTRRIAHLVRERSVPPGECLAITFTRRAAAEMAKRLEALVPDVAEDVPVMTFHALGLSILRDHGSRLGLPDPRIAAHRQRRELLREALSVSERQAERLLARISRMKRQGEASDPDPEDVEVRRALELHDARLRERGEVDFDDLIALPVRLLEEDPDIVAAYRARYRWISVDEYQDIDPLQYRLVKLLAPADGNLCVIGDPDQAIYGFRGADVRFFQRFQDDFPSARTVHLVRNYRSARTIVDASSQMIAPASLVPGRRLESRIPGPERLEIHECATERAEAELVVHSIERLVGGSTFFSIDSGRVASHEGGALSFGDFAVLYRADAQAAALVEALHRSGIPFQKRSHQALAEVASVEAVLRAMEASLDSSRDGLAVHLERAAAEVRETDPGIDGFLPPLRSLAERHRNDFPGLLSELALGVDVDFWDPRAEAVSLLTLHAAKGLEFPVVFIVGCEDGILPLRWAGSAEDPGEERRLFYVGMTRARERLFLSHARRRAWRGPPRDMERSPFLQDIEERLLALHDHRSSRKRPECRQLSFF